MTDARVLMITGEYPPMTGGIADYTALLVAALRRADVDVRVLSGRDTDADEQMRGWNWRTPQHVRDIVQRGRINMVHIQYQAGAFGMHPAINVLPALIQSARVVTTFHDLRPPYLFPKAGRLRFLTMRRMARASNGVVVTNPADARVMHDSQIACRQIRLGPSLPRPADTSEHDNSVGYFGFPSRQKGFDLLVEAIGQIPSGRRPVLRIVGGTPPTDVPHGFLSHADVDGLATQFDVHTTWSGYLPPAEASRELASCGAIAFPFPSGATLRSSALIAALQTGRPVITTAPRYDGDLGELATTEQLIISSTPDPAALKNAILTAIQMPTVTASLPPAFEWEQIAKRHQELYVELLRESSL